MCRLFTSRDSVFFCFEAKRKNVRSTRNFALVFGLKNFTPNWKRLDFKNRFRAWKVFRGAIHSTNRSDRSDREKRSTSKGSPVFSKLFRLDRTDPLSFGPKFPEILVEWIALQVFWETHAWLESFPARRVQANVMVSGYPSKKREENGGVRCKESSSALCYIFFNFVCRRE